jgi:hypothetical protein
MSPTSAAKEKAPKIAPVTYKTDDCAIVLGRKIDAGVETDKGEEHFVHIGETVTMIPANSMREVIALGQMARGSIELQSEEIEASEVAKLSGQASDALCEALSKRIVSWTWTDNFHEALANPHNNPKALQDLTADEVFYLIRLAQGEHASERKNGSRPSEPSS